jgi:hypothetical protein
MRSETGATTDPAIPRISLRRDGLVWRVVDKAVVLLDLRASRYFCVNSSGTLLWRLLAEGSTPARLAGELARSYALDSARASDDVDRFVGHLDSLGLLERELLGATAADVAAPFR